MSAKPVNSETPIDRYDQLISDLQQLCSSLECIKGEKECSKKQIEHLKAYVSQLEHDEGRIQNRLNAINHEKDSLRNFLRGNSCFPQSITESSKTENHPEPSSNENKKTAQRSETPLTTNEEDAHESIPEKSDSVATNVETPFVSPQGSNPNGVYLATIFKMTAMGALFHVKKDGKEITHNHPLGHANVFKFQSPEFIKKISNAEIGLTIPVKLDRNYPATNFVWSVDSPKEDTTYIAKVIDFNGEEKVGNTIVGGVTVLELYTRDGVKKDGTFTFGLFNDYRPYYPKNKCPEFNETYVVSLTTNRRDDPKKVYFIPNYEEK
jgi:hypothetical protein